MANPIVYRQESTEAGETTLTITFAVGATGAVGAITPGSRSKEFRRATPVSRVSAGVYDVFLREAWLACLGVSGGVVGNGVAFAATDGWGPPLFITDNASTASAPKVRVQFNRPDNGVAADPASGTLATVRVHLKRLKPV